MPIGNKTHISTADAAILIGVSTQTIRRWIDNKRFSDVRRPSKRVILINKEEVIEIKNRNYFATETT